MSSSSQKLDDPSSSTTSLDRDNEIDGCLTVKADKDIQVEIFEVKSFLIKV